MAEPILVNGGLVETRDPTMFAAGELARAQDAYYKANNPAIWSVLGRIAFNTTPIAETIFGLRYLEYDGFPDVLLVRAGDKIYEADAADLTGEFTSEVSGLVSDGVATFDSCHYNNQQVLFDGVNRNRVRDKDGTYRFQGMLVNDDAPVYSNSGSGVGFILAAGSVLTYWIEEQVRDGNGTILRRNSSPSTTQTVTVTGTGASIKPRIFRPDQVNPDATHFVLYVSAVDGLFPIGASIGQATIDKLFIDDTRSSFTLPKLLTIADAHGIPFGGALQIINQLNQAALAAAALVPISPGLPDGEIYQTVTVTLDNITQMFPRNGPIPIATTADIMEDSMIMNDVSDRSKVWFTFPDNIDQMPYTNFIRFETKGADEVQWVRFLGRGAIVALRDSIWRIDTLPQPVDASFQISRVKTQLEGAHGGIGTLTVAPFSFGQRNLLAYVSRAGIMVTDGETWWILTGDVDWQTRVDITKLNQAFLMNNPIDFRLEFTYTPLGGAVNSETMFLHYHPSHAKESATGSELVKVTVPVKRGGRGKTVANVGGADIVFSAQTDGKIYHEWVGLVDPLGDIEFDVQTGDKFPFGVGKNARADRWWVHHQATGNDQRAETYVLQRTEGQDDVEEAREFPMKRREHTSVYADVQGNAFIFGVRATNPSAQIGIDYFVPEFSDEGVSTDDGEP
jgi:hypothetical protein